MGGGFVSPGTQTIVAAGAVACLSCYRTVIKQDLQPVGGVMAYVASLGSRYVGGALAGGYSAVVAIFTHIRGLAVIQGYHKSLPARTGGMTGFAQVRGHRVRSGFVSGIGTAVTVRASSGGLIVGERYD